MSAVDLASKRKCISAAIQRISAFSFTRAVALADLLTLVTSPPLQDVLTFVAGYVGVIELSEATRRAELERDLSKVLL